jgi:hypothetical protein
LVPDDERPRRRFLAGLAAAGLVGAGCGTGSRAAPPAPQPIPQSVPQSVPPPADPAAVLARALDAARAGPNSGLILFIARYPDAPITAAARGALAARRRPDPGPAPGPDGAIVAAFDRARLAGPAALAAFARAYPNHPLGAEALRPEWRQPEGR